MEQHKQTQETEETFEFESFFDDDSGMWTLRRISSVPPKGTDDDTVA